LLDKQLGSMSSRSMLNLQQYGNRLCAAEGDGDGDEKIVETELFDNVAAREASS
jgi:hypothetical protein